MANIISINGFGISSSNAGGDFVPSAWTGSSTSQFSGTASLASTASFVRTAQTASYVLNAVSASLASTASYFEKGNSTISSDGTVLTIFAGRLSITGANAIGIVSGNAINLEGSIVSQGEIRPGGPFTNDVSNYSLGSTSAAWKNIYANNLTTFAGTTTIPPIRLIAGTNLTSPTAGAIEYDGVTLYRTNDTTSGRGYEPSTQIFRLTANGSAIGPAIANFFGANSAIQLAAGGVYEIEAYCAFTKTTTGTVTVTITTSAAPQNLNGTIQNGASTGGTTTGAANQISIFNSTSTAAAFGASISLNNGANHLFCIKLLVEANASASNLRINFTNNVSGTVTPLRGSYYKVTKLPSGNVGNFVA